jgi:hypothetical protein
LQRILLRDLRDRTKTSEAMIQVAMIRVMLRRLA